MAQQSPILLKQLKTKEMHMIIFCETLRTTVIDLSWLRPIGFALFKSHTQCNGWMQLICP